MSLAPGLRIPVSTGSDAACSGLQLSKEERLFEMEEMLLARHQGEHPTAGRTSMCLKEDLASSLDADSEAPKDTYNQVTLRSWRSSSLLTPGARCGPSFQALAWVSRSVV